MEIVYHMYNTSSWFFLFSLFQATMDAAPPSYEEARNEGQTIKGLDPQPPRYSDPESQMPTPSGEIEINVQ